jgi:twinkle protein
MVQIVEFKMSQIFTDDDIDYSLYIRETENQTKLKNSPVYKDDLKDRLRNKAKGRQVFLPWEKTQINFDFRPHEVSVWAGQNGHGKSLVTAQVALSLIGQGETVAIASFELKPVMTVQRLARMYIQTNPFAPEYQNDSGRKAIEDLYDEFFGFTDGKLWIYDHQGSIDMDRVIGMVRYCAKEKGIKHIFVDNLAKCVKNEDDYNGQKFFIDEMMSIAKDYACHIHVVHHVKKPAKEVDRPDKNDIKGSGSIADQPDNVFLVWRNKAKEDGLKEFQMDKQDEPDQVLFCKKQRNYEGGDDGEPTILLWFDRDSTQYLAGPQEKPMFFPNFPHRATP